MNMRTCMHAHDGRRAHKPLYSGGMVAVRGDRDRLMYDAFGYYNAFHNICLVGAGRWPVWYDGASDHYDYADLNNGMFY